MSSTDDGQGDHVMTVLGPVAPGAIGPTLMHEHVFMDARAFWDPSELYDRDLGGAPMGAKYAGLARWNGSAFRDDLHTSPHEMDMVIEEVREFADAGGSCLVELTIHGIHPAPMALREVSERLGLHIVEGCGFYVHATHPDWVEGASVEDLVDFIQREVREGIDGSGVLPGIIGEIGTSEAIFPCEEQILRASARVAVNTGTAVNIHCHPSTLAVTLRIIDVLTEDGLDPERIYLSHLDEITDLEYHTRVLERGVTTGFDSFGQDGYFSPTWKSLSDLEKMRTMVALIERGFEDQLVMSQDMGKKHYLRQFGGMGYDHVMRRVVPRLQQHFGVDDAVVEKLLVDNPRKLLTRTSAVPTGLLSPGNVGEREGSV